MAIKIRMDPQEIINFVCDYLNVDKKMVLSRTRKKPYPEIRRIIIYFLVKYTYIYRKETLTKIGELFSNLTHCDIIFHNKRANELMQVDKNFNNLIENIEELMIMKIGILIEIEKSKVNNKFWEHCDEIVKNEWYANSLIGC